jgi:NADH-quinone oxidoreductase subunit E
MQEQLDEVFAQFDGNPGDLIPVLQSIQDVLGYLPEEAMTETARFLNVAESTVYGVATFYTQFHLTRQGRHRIKVCQGTACHVRGGNPIMEAVKKKIGIGPGETTKDYQFSVERVACFGSCALAPVMVVNDEVHGRMTPQRAEEILETLH